MSKKQSKSAVHVSVKAPMDLDRFGIAVQPIAQLAEESTMTVRPGVDYEAVSIVEAAVFRSIQDYDHTLFDSLDADSPASAKRFDYLNDWIKFLAANRLDAMQLSSLSVDTLLYTLVAAKMQLTYLAGTYDNE